MTTPISGCTEIVQKTAIAVAGAIAGKNQIARKGSSERLLRLAAKPIRSALSITPIVERIEKTIVTLIELRKSGFTTSSEYFFKPTHSTGPTPGHCENESRRVEIIGRRNVATKRSIAGKQANNTGTSVMRLTPARPEFRRAGVSSSLESDFVKTARLQTNALRCHILYMY